MAFSRKSSKPTNPTPAAPVAGGNLCPKCGGLLAPSKFKANTLYCTNYKSGCKFQGPSGGTRTAVVGKTLIPKCGTLSDEQLAIVLAAKDGNNMLVEALAGTGKTFNLVQLIRELAQEQGLSVLAVAFAKRDQLDLESRACGQATVLTSNSAGYRILGEHIRRMGGRLNLDDSVPFNMITTRWRAEGLITKDAAGKETWNVGRATLSNVLELVDKARGSLALSATDPTLPRSPSDADWSDLMGRFNIEVSTDDLPEVISWANWLFGELANLKNVSTWGTDFAGQIFLPSYHNLKPSKTFDRVLIDEFQDQSYPTRRIAELYLAPNGRFVAVGDRHQGIYSWRGADKDAVEDGAKMMEKHGGAPTRFPLTLCRRCPQAVIRVAQNIVPQIQALPDAPEGEFRTIPADADFLAELVSKRAGLVLCRANAPAVSACLKLLKEGIPAALVRSDIVGQLIKLVEKASGKAFDAAPVTDVLAGINEWRDDQLAKLAKRPNGAKSAQVVTDKAETIHHLAGSPDIKTAGDLKRRIDSLFPARVTNSAGQSVPANEVPMKERAGKMVLFSTVHGAKGGEAPTVYLYSPDSYKVCLWDAVWSDATDRDNVLYVAITRAEHSLIFAGKPPTLARMSDADAYADAE